MADNLEREIAIKDLYASFQRNARPEWVDAALRQTGGLSITEILDSCEKIKHEIEFPQNIGAAICKIAYDSRRAKDLIEHNQVKYENAFEKYNGPKARFLQLLQKSNIFFLKSCEIKYSQFWEMINKAWLDVCDELDFNDKSHTVKLEQVMSFAEDLFQKVTRETEISTPTQPLEMS